MNRFVLFIMILLLSGCATKTMSSSGIVTMSYCLDSTYIEEEQSEYTTTVILKLMGRCEEI